jgi:hypothetical protein
MKATPRIMLLLAGLIMVSMISAACTGQDAEDPPNSTDGKAAVTALTDENYALAETQVIFADYVKRIAKATNTNGVGVFMHNREGADPKDRTVVRINFDTLYSFAVIDLNEDLTLVMPETNGRYQSAWIISEDHYNPGAFTAPGDHVITRDWVGTRYAMVVMRTQVNTHDADDVKAVNALQDRIELNQKDKGSYVASHAWDMDEILKMRAKYMEIANNMSTDVMFGRRGEVPLRNHNAGTAFGWGGLTPQQAVYPQYFPRSDDPQTLTLKDVPVKAFWSITVYDAEGYPQTDTYNINSAFAVPGADGACTIHFGGDSSAENYMEIFEGWNFTLRMYQPTEAYFNGQWVKPDLAVVN